VVGGGVVCGVVVCGVFVCCCLGGVAKGGHAWPGSLLLARPCDGVVSRHLVLACALNQVSR
jgi:hypothetical protein